MESLISFALFFFKALIVTFSIYTTMIGVGYAGQMIVSAYWESKTRGSIALADHLTGKGGPGDEIDVETEEFAFRRKHVVQ